MQTTPEQQASFSKTLNHEIEQTQLLLELLQREFELLKAPTSTNLKDLTEEKKQLLLKVEQCVSHHNQLLLSHGYTPDRKGTEAFIQHFSDREQLEERWQKFSALLAECQKQNEINGGAVKLNHHQVSQALDVLRGFVDSDKTYGPAGESRPTSSSKSLGKA